MKHIVHILSLLFLWLVRRMTELTYHDAERRRHALAHVDRCAGYPMTHAADTMSALIVAKRARAIESTKVLAKAFGEDFDDSVEQMARLNDRAYEAIGLADRVGLTEQARHIREAHRHISDYAAALRVKQML